jgi:hypothetical protein
MQSTMRAQVSQLRAAQAARIVARRGAVAARALKKGDVAPAFTLVSSTETHRGRALPSQPSHRLSAASPPPPRPAHRSARCPPPQPNQDGRAVAVKAGGKDKVVYFYPKDASPGCTIQAKAFRDANAVSALFLLTRRKKTRSRRKPTHPLTADQSSRPVNNRRT